jgi:hypothetical protein
MPAAERRITRQDIPPLAVYAAERDHRRKAIIELKRDRRVPVGPYATFYFENFDTMLQQVLEMLHIEKGGEAQIADELSAYNPLIPQGRDLSATLMFEIPDPVQRDKVLRTLGGVDECVFLDFGGRRIAATAEKDVARTTAAGKTSSVHFLHFPFDETAAAAFKAPGARATLAIEHPNYGHIAVIPEASRAALAQDLA